MICYPSEQCLDEPAEFALFSQLRTILNWRRIGEAADVTLFDRE